MTQTLVNRDLGRTVLCVDGGSSSLKIAMFAVDADGERLLDDGEVEAIGVPNASLRIRDYRGVCSRETGRALGDEVPVASVLAFVHGLGVVPTPIEVRKRSEPHDVSYR